MDREQTALFIGHRDCAALKPQQLEDAIIKHIEQGVRLFLLYVFQGWATQQARLFSRMRRRWGFVRYILSRYHYSMGGLQEKGRQLYKFCADLCTCQQMR